MSWPACLYVKALHAYCYIRPIFFCQAGLILILSCINACSVSCHNTNLRNFLFKIKALRSHTSCLILGNILQINLILAQAYILQDPSASYLFFKKCMTLCSRTSVFIDSVVIHHHWLLTPAVQSHKWSTTASVWNLSITNFFFMLDQFTPNSGTLRPNFGVNSLKY